MSYRNKTYVAFASEDINYYWMMTAWRANKHIDFNFHDAHDLNTARDTSTPETIKRRLRERLANTKQVVLLGSPDGKRKGGNGTSFFAYEVETVISLGLPVVIANLDGSRTVKRSNIPDPLLTSGYYTESVSFGATIIKYALDDYASRFASSSQTGPYYYNNDVYDQLGLSK
ncbi:TIR domain-containing protein [Xylanimonas protaetiae]|uniref:Molecular chaperone Tir n=1 Tax=Xylanimonas protaetiae TaxID=2509457 RepID=A0A4P6F2T1_9MICO|nr:TIR domain-containing protein [Xylanimonas protaetiae]QAY69485.1 molecular chaperone Tir [Xylanimonas protaetiae]